MPRDSPKKLDLIAAFGPVTSRITKEEQSCMLDNPSSRTFTYNKPAMSLTHYDTVLYVRKDQVSRGLIHHGAPEGGKFFVPTCPVTA